MRRFVAALGAVSTAAAVTVLGVAGPAAAAATPLPATRFMSVDRISKSLGGDSTAATFSFHSVAGAYYYDLMISANGRTQTIRAGGNYGQPTGELEVYDIHLDPCVSYTVSVGTRDMDGIGKTTGKRLEPSLLPGGIIAASAKRGSDPTTATFSWSPPVNRGYAMNADGTGYKSATPVVLYFNTELIRMSDKKVIKTSTVYSYTAGTKISVPVTGLDPKGAYLMRVRSSNYFGGCAAKDGRILLNRA